jgi:hypothetical protein
MLSKKPDKLLAKLNERTEQKGNQLLRALYNNLITKSAFGKIVSYTFSAMYFTSSVSRKMS